MHYLLYFLAILCLSQSPNWVKYSGAPPLELGFWRLFFASLIWFGVWLAVRLRSAGVARVNATSPSVEALTPGRARLWAVVAGVIFFFHLWAFHYAAQHTRIANLMILFASNPLFTSILTITFFKNPWHRGLIGCYALALGGLLYLFSGDVVFTSEQLMGNVAAVLSAALFAGYIVASQQARRFYSTLDFSLHLYPIASACFLLYIVANGLPLWPESPKVWFVIGGLTIFSTMLGHSLFSYLLKHLNINFMSFGKLIEPILASIAAYFIFAEALTLHHLVAFILVAAGVGLYIWEDR